MLRASTLTKEEQTILKLMEQGATGPEIASAIGLNGRSRTLVYYRCRLAQEKAAGRQELPEEWTVSAAADVLGIDRKLAFDIVSTRGFFYRRRGKRNGTYILRKMELKALRKYLASEPLVRVCSVCAQKFTLWSIRDRRLACSPQCKSKRENARRKKRRTIPDSFRGWRKFLLSVGFNYFKEISNEEWLSLGEAVQVSGLSKNQIINLGDSELVAVRLHPTRTWRGLPQRTYAQNQMQHAGEIYRAWKAEQDP